MQDKIYNIITKESEITWQTIIYDLIKKEELEEAEEASELEEASESENPGVGGEGEREQQVAMGSMNTPPVGEGVSGSESVRRNRSTG